MASEATVGAEERLVDATALATLAEAYATPPPSRLRERVLAEVRRVAEARRRDQRVFGYRLVAALAAGVILALAALLVREGRLAKGRGSEIAALARANARVLARIDEQDRAIASLRRLLEIQAQVFHVIGGPRTRSITLAPQAGARGSGRVLVDTTSGETAVVLAGLAPITEDRIYELWAIRGKRAPEPAGLFTVAAEQPLAVRVQPLDKPQEITAFAISLEPSGGSDEPTGPIVLVGSVEG